MSIVTFNCIRCIEVKELDRRIIRKHSTNPLSGSQVALCLFSSALFCVGIVLGEFMAGRTDMGVNSDLVLYLKAFLERDSNADAFGSNIMAAGALYFKSPLLIFALSFFPVSVVTLPLVMLSLGASLSFSVSCFFSAFHRDGILLALSVFGIRTAVMLPCCFFIAFSAFSRYTGEKNLQEKKLFCKRQFFLLLLISGVLLAGVCLELLVVPQLIDAALRHLFS